MKKNAHNTLRILIVEDNETMREGMVQVLSKKGHAVQEAADGSMGLKAAQEQNPDLIITDFKMEGMDGMQLLHELQSWNPEALVIMITAYGTIDLAVEAMKAGAWDFIAKPFSKEELLLKVDRVEALMKEREQARLLTEENIYLREQMNASFNNGEIVGASASMNEIYRIIEKVAANDTSVLIYGESGTGKELVARAIHFQSQRKDRPFIRVNCGALAEGVLESELFGHEKGSFTGALRQKFGRFELAHQGTLFLDEIGDISQGTQVKLLRVLQEKEFERVGGEETIHVDVRVLAATHRDLLQEVKAGKFREDLYYRLHILPIKMPPLRERKDDIPLLADHFLDRICKSMHRKKTTFSDESIRVLMSYDWPGNVRELENVLERAVVLCEGEKIDASNLSMMLCEHEGTKIAGESWNIDAAVVKLEKQLIEKALKVSNGVKARAAKLLGIKEGTLYYKMEKYHLS